MPLPVGGSALVEPTFETRGCLPLTASGEHPTIGMGGNIEVRHYAAIALYGRHVAGAFITAGTLRGP